MRIVREATIHTQPDTPPWCVRPIVASFLQFARSQLPRDWPPIPATESLTMRRVPEGYRLVYSVEVES